MSKMTMYAVMLRFYIIVYVYHILFLIILDVLFGDVCFRVIYAFICVHCIVFYSSGTEA